MGILLVSHSVSWKEPMQKWDFAAYMPCKVASEVEDSS